MAENPIGNVASELGSRIFGNILTFGLVLLLIVVIAIVMWYFFHYRRKFDIDAKVISYRAEDKNKIIWDKGAILRDKKSKDPYFRLLNTKIELPMPNFNVLQSTNKGDFVEMYRKSENEVGFLTPSKIDNKRVIKRDGKISILADQNHIQIDLEDAYWRARKNEENRNMFNKDKVLWKLLELAPSIIGSVVLLFAMYILMKYLPQTLGQVQDLVKELNKRQTADVIQSLLPLISIKWWMKK